MNEIFIPHNLEKIEVDVKNKVFKINGEDFGRDCTKFTITCKPDGWEIRAAIDTTVTFSAYDKSGMQKEKRTFETNDL